MRRKFARCAGVASDKRQDQASGTLIIRPSTRSAIIWSFVTRMLRMRGSQPTLVTMFIPRLQDSSEMGPDEPPNQVQLSGAETMIAGKRWRLDPELAGSVLPFDMNMGRLAAVEAREEQPIRPTNTSDSRHSTALHRPHNQRACET